MSYFERFDCNNLLNPHPVICSNFPSDFKVILSDKDEYGNQYLVDYYQYKIHDGDIFSVGVNFKILASEAKYCVIYNTSRFNITHLKFNLRSYGLANFGFYEDPVVSNLDTILEAKNLNRLKKDTKKNTDVNFYTGSGIKDNGSIIFAGESEYEIILEPLRKYLLKISNNLTSSIFVDVNFYFYNNEYYSDDLGIIYANDGELYDTYAGIDDGTVFSAINNRVF